MNQTVSALVVKLVMTAIFAAVAFMWLTTNPWGWVLTVAVVATILNYLVGDLFVLPKAGNVVASVGDGVLAGLTAYIVDWFSPVFHTTITSLVVFGVLIAIGECFFHQYLRKSEKVKP